MSPKVKSDKRSMMSIPVASIVTDEPWQVRSGGTAAHAGGVEDLAASMLEGGQLVPVLVHASGPGKYTVIDGHRRVAAARALVADGAWKADAALLAVVSPKPASASDALSMALAAQDAREGVTPAARMLAVGRIMAGAAAAGEHVTQGRVARLCNCSQPHVAWCVGTYKALPAKWRAFVEREDARRPVKMATLNHVVKARQWHAEQGAELPTDVETAWRTCIEWRPPVPPEECAGPSAAEEDGEPHEGEAREPGRVLSAAAAADVWEAIRLTVTAAAVGKASHGVMAAAWNLVATAWTAGLVGSPEEAAAAGRLVRDANLVGVEADTFRRALVELHDALQTARQLDIPGTADTRAAEVPGAPAPKRKGKRKGD